MKHVKTFFTLTMILLVSIISISSSEIVQSAAALSITGTSANEHLKGTDGRDYISGEGGDDFIQGFAGSDSLYGRDGNDRLDGGRGNDKLSGGKGDDRLRGGIGNDILTGGLGADSFDCGSGNDTVEDYSVSEGDTVAANCEVVHFLNPSLVAHWKFDDGAGSGIAIDSSGSGNTGTVANGPVWLTSTECVDGTSCLSFDGVDDYVNAGNSPSLQIANDITVSAWIKKPTTTTVEVCLGKYFTADRGWVLIYDGDFGGIIRFDGRDGSGNYRSVMGPELDDNNWHHVVGERAGSVWKIYVDGVLANQNDVGTAGSISASLDDLYIGRYGGTEHCKATIDDVRVYSGALSASEIQQLYSQYNAPPPTTGLVAHWKFDEGKGSTTVDSSHNGNLGKVSGATWQSSTECIVGDSCLRFDGINDFMNGGNSPSLQISNDITVSAWIKKAPIAFEAEVCLGKYFNTPDTGWVLVYDTDGTVHFDGRDGSGIYKKSVGPVLDDNEWHFVTGQREGSVWKIYVDGTLRDANDVSYAGSINAISDNLYVGRYSPSSGYCEATIDDVRIFNAALSDEEILQIYQESLLQ